jgi:hypothetical protein
LSLFRWTDSAAVTPTLFWRSTHLERFVRPPDCNDDRPGAAPH